MKSIIQTIKRISFSALFMALLLFQGACIKDFLDIKPQGSLTEELYLTNADEAKQAVNGIYSSMRNWHFFTGGYPILDIMSDDAVKGSNPGDAAILNLYNEFAFNPQAGGVSNWYSALYESIRRANFVINGVPDIDMDKSLKNRYLGEARYLRAYFYFRLVQAFGDVPKVLVISPPGDLGRTDKEEIYNTIIFPDLEFAYENLPEKDAYSASDLGRVTKGTVRTLLADIYLFRKDYVNAEKYALEVIQSNQYDLEPDFSNAFSIAGQHGIESIFEIGALPEENTTLGGNQFANTQGVRGVPNRGWGFNRPTLDLINSYEAGDERMDKTVIFLGEILDGVTIEGDESTPDTTFTDDTETEIAEIECYNQKVWVPGSTTLEEWGFNVRIYRYAEVLLIAAEALNENGNSPQALTYMNLLRQRAGLTDFISADQNEIRLQIWKERRSELAMEGKRYFDVVRQGRGSEVFGDLGFVAGKHELLPIPQSEIDISNGLITQNPSW